MVRAPTPWRVWRSSDRRIVAVASTSPLREVDGMSYGLLLLRLFVGAAFFGHGTQKLFGWWGGYGPQGTGGFFASQGYRYGVPMAVLAGLAEAGGGALLALGLATPLACTAIA